MIGTLFQQILTAFYGSMVRRVQTKQQEKEAGYGVSAWTDHSQWGTSFQTFLFEGRNGNYVREKHWHTSIEILLWWKGNLSFYINEVEYPLKAGEFLIIEFQWNLHSIQAPVRNETIVLQIPLKQFTDYFTAQRFIRFHSGNTSQGIRLYVSHLKEQKRNR